MHSCDLHCFLFNFLSSYLSTIIRGWLLCLHLPSFHCYLPLPLLSILFSCWQLNATSTFDVLSNIHFALYDLTRILLMCATLVIPSSVPSSFHNILMILLLASPPTFTILSSTLATSIYLTSFLCTTSFQTSLIKHFHFRTHAKKQCSFFNTFF